MKKFKYWLIGQNKVIFYDHKDLSNVLNYISKQLRLYYDKKVILNGYLVYGSINFQEVWRVKISTIMYLCQIKNITLSELTVKDIEGFVIND